MKVKRLWNTVPALLLCGLGILFCFDYYKFRQQGIFRHTALDFLFLWLSAVALVAAAWRLSRDRINAKWFLFALSLLIALMISEFFLRSIHRNQSSMEAREGIYVSPYHSSLGGLLYDYTHKHTFYLESPEFRYKRQTNSLGITGPEPTLQKDSGTIRILAMGDSYTDGDGADYDSSYVSFLRRMLPEKFPCRKFDLINAGVCGSDPFFNYIHLEKTFLPYHPDLVLVSISSGDMDADIMVRGGMERFANGQKATYRKAPWWEPVYAISFLFRLVAADWKHVDLSLLTPEDYTCQKLYLDSVTTDLMKRFEMLGEQRHFKTIFMLHPFAWELIKGQYNYDFSVLQKSTAEFNNLQWYDMKPEYQRMIELSGKPVEHFFWAQNGHHNAAGYEVMADAAFECVKGSVAPCETE